MNFLLILFIFEYLSSWLLDVFISSSSSSLLLSLLMLILLFKDCFCDVVRRLIVSFIWVSLQFAFAIMLGLDKDTVVKQLLITKEMYFDNKVCD